MPNLDIPQRDIATAEAAKLVLANLQKVLRDTTSPLKLIQQALIPVFGIRWDVRVVRRITRNVLCNILWSLRNSKLSKTDYERVRQLWREAMETDDSFPAEWSDWRVVIERFNLDDKVPLKKWTDIVDSLRKLGWLSPPKLAQCPSISFAASFPEGPLKDPAHKLWLATVMLFAEPSSPSFHVLEGASQDCEKFLRRLKLASTCRTAATNDVKTAISKLRQPANFDKLGPAARIKAIRQANLPQFKTNRFFRTAAQSTALQGVLFCFPSFASGIRCYYSFCELRNNPPFPVSERVVIEWSSVFSCGATFSNYVGYVRKACHFLQHPLTWDTAALANIIAALKLQDRGKYVFPNFIRSDLVHRIISHDSRDSPFAQLAYLSFLYALRVPSEAINLMRACKHDDLTGHSPMKERALIGIRGKAPRQCLVIRFSRRKNLPRGCILSRPCFCSLAAPKAKRFCPVHSMWPCIASRVQSGQMLFPMYSATSVNTTIKAVLAKIGVDFAHSYSSHGFRRGATQELKEKGSQISVIATVGEWRSLAFLGYVDTALDVARDMSKLLIETEELTDEEVQPLGNGILRGR